MLHLHAPGHNAHARLNNMSLFFFKSGEQSQVGGAPCARIASSDLAFKRSAAIEISASGTHRLTSAHSSKGGDQADLLLRRDFKTACDVRKTIMTGSPGNVNVSGT
jgi:hypothetical protein